MVAVYPICLLAVALVVWSAAAEARAESTIRVGYYDMTVGAGVPGEQESPIVAAGFTPVQLFNVTAADLAGIHVLFVQNPGTMGYGSEYLAERTAIQAAVNAGLILVIHDRAVGPSPMMTRAILPLPPGVMPVVSRMNSNNNNVSAVDSLVANGPAGVIDDANLDNGNFSNMGFVNLLTLSSLTGRQGLLHTGTNTNSSVTFSYPMGLGAVIYSSIPLDFYAKGGGPEAVRAAFMNIYAPNVLTYAACGLRALPATLSVTEASGLYGGSVTLTASLRCGVLPLQGLAVEFFIAGRSVGFAETDASGMATLFNASLGETADSAIAAGVHPGGISATFEGTAQYGPSHGSAALTVEKAAATIHVVGGSVVYDGRPHPATGSVTGAFGEPLGEPSFTYAEATTGVTSDVPPVNAGRYVVTATFEGSENYLDETSSDAIAVEIAPAPLKVIADDKERLAGVPNPVLTISYEGFAPGETAQNLDARPRAVTPVTLATVPGTYAIDVAGAADPNYVFEYVPGTFTVSPEGRMHGSGFTDINGARHQFVFETRDTVVLGEKGTVSLRIERAAGDDLVFVSGLATSVVFINDPAVVPGGGAVADGVSFAGHGTWNGAAATFQAVAMDKAEPGAGHDTFTLTIQVAGLTVSRTTGTISGGNVQSNRLPGRR
jgi:hypothetical protein